MNNYRYKLAKQRKQEIETHRYFLLFQEYLHLLEKEQTKGAFIHEHQHRAPRISRQHRS